MEPTHTTAGFLSPTASPEEQALIADWLTRDFNLIAKNEKLRQCILRGVVFSMAPPEIPYPCESSINVAPLVALEEILSVIYSLPGNTIWDKTRISFDVFYYLVNDPALYEAACKLKRMTQMEPFIFRLLQMYNNDLKAHFFPSPGVINREESDEEGRKKVLELLPSWAALKVKMESMKGTAQIVGEVFDTYDLLTECLSLKYVLV